MPLTFFEFTHVNIVNYQTNINEQTFYENEDMFAM